MPMQDFQVEEGLAQAIAHLDDKKVSLYTDELIRSGKAPQELQVYLNKGLQKVNELFESGEYFIADLMYAGMLCRYALERFSSVLPRKSSKGIILIGVVERDIHDIGKDIISALLYADGFEVIDLGNNVSPQMFVDAINKYHPQILLLSGMMHFSQDSMKRTIESIKNAGLRSQVKILLGGGCVDPWILNRMDADAVALEPLETVNTCNIFINRRKQ